jgi:hypothetical protein
MSPARRLFIVLVSIGWIVPFSLAFWAEHDFIFNGLFEWLNTGQRTIYSFHPVIYAPRIFLCSMAWLAGVIVWWVLRLTRSPESKG